MKILKIISLTVGVLGVLFIVFLAYLGIFRTVEVTRAEFGPVEAISFPHRGKYHHIGKSWEAFMAAWKAAGLAECDGFAIYLDPPTAPPEKLRSVLACRIDALPSAEQKALKSKFAHFSLPKVDTVTTSFPFKNFFSFMVGPMKSYPALHKEVEAAGGHPSYAIETYGPLEKLQTLHFFLPLHEDRDATARIVWKD